MEATCKKILKSLSVELRHLLEGQYDEQGTWHPGDLETRLNALGVWRNRDARPRDEMGHLPTHDQGARKVVDGYLELRREAGIGREAAVAEFVRETAYCWANRLMALRCMEARDLIDEVILQKDAYGGRSLQHHRLAQRQPEACAGEDDGLFAVLDAAFTAQTRHLPLLFDPSAAGVSLRPSIPALRRAIGLLSGRVPVKAQETASSEMFHAADALGWFYQFWQQDEKKRVDELVKTKKGYKCEGADIVPKTALYTEPYMVKFLVQNSLGATWFCMRPDTRLAEGWEYFVRDADRAPAEPKRVADITFLDPACGSGHFLIEAFDVFYGMYEEEGELTESPAICDAILRHNLHGIDIDERAVQIAEAALWMKAAEKAFGFEGAPHNLLATNIRLPKGKDHLKAFLAKHPDDEPLRPALELIFESLEHADELGSLLQLEEPVEKELRHQREHHALLHGGVDWGQWKQDVLGRLRQHFEDEAVSSDLVQAFFGRSAGKGLALFDALSRRYDVVAANPPYMGSKSMGAMLKKYVGKHYAPGKRDLFAAFMLRCLGLSRSVGRVAMVTQQTWMFLGSYADLRFVGWEAVREKPGRFAGLLQDCSIEALAHMGRYAFSEIGAGIVIPVLVTFQVSPPAQAHRLWACRLTARRPAEEQAALLYRSAQETASPSVYRPAQSRFLGIRESPLCYWLRERFYELLVGSTLAEHATVRAGLGPGCDPRYARFAWEVAPHEWKARLTLRRWFPYEKGGGYGKWYGHHFWVVEWQYSGMRIRAADLPGTRLQNESYYLHSGWIYSSMASGCLAGRWLEDSLWANLIADAVIPLDDASYVLGSLLNSRVASVAVRWLRPQAVLSGSYVERVPVPDSVSPVASTVADLCLRLKRTLVEQDLLERSFTHAAYPAAESIVRAATSAQLGAHHTAVPLHTLEGLSEWTVMQAHGLDADDRAAVLAETGTPASWFPPVRGYDRGAFEGFDDAPPDVLQALGLQGLACTPVSALATDALCKRLHAAYEAGPGQDEPSDESDSAVETEGDEPDIDLASHIPIPPETFLEELSQKLQIHPISVYWLLKEGIEKEGWRCLPEERRITADRFTVMILHLLGHRWPRQVEAGEPVPDWAERTGIISLTEGTDDDTLYDRIRGRIPAEFPGGNVAAIEREFEEIMGKSLQAWLAADFFKHHVKQFKKRPIAWQLQSSTGTASGRSSKGAKRPPAFACMVYYHRLDDTTLTTIQTQYVRPLRLGYQTELRGIEKIEPEKRSDDQEKRRVLLDAWVDELDAFDIALERVTREGFASKALGEILAREAPDRWCSSDGRRAAPTDREALHRQEMAYHPDINDGVRVNIAPLLKAGLLAPADILAAKDVDKAIADRAEWRSDERRWCREGKLPQPGWWPAEVLAR